MTDEPIPPEIVEQQQRFLDQMRKMPRSDEIAEYSSRFVAFLDILGFREVLAQMAKDSPNRLFHDIVDSQWFHAATASVDIEIISDSIIITSKDGHPASFIRVAYAANSLRDSFLERGFLLRGAIAFGNHFHAHGIRISPALVEAYELESRVTTYPRIVCSSSALGQFLPAITKNEKGRAGIAKSPYFHVIRDEVPEADFDGLKVLPFLPDTLEVYYLRTGHHHDPNYQSSAEQIVHFNLAGPQRLDKWRDGIEIARSRCRATRHHQKVGYVIEKWNKYITSFKMLTTKQIASYLLKQT